MTIASCLLSLVRCQMTVFQLSIDSLCIKGVVRYPVYSFEMAFFAWVPSLKPFLNRLVSVFMYRIRPVPTVLRPLAFCPQL